MKRKLLIGMALVLMSLLLVGCGGWVAREDHEAVIAERDAAQTEVTSLQGDLGKAQSQIETLESDLSKAESQIKTLQDELTPVAEDPPEAFVMEVLMGAQTEEVQTEEEAAATIELANTQSAVIAMMVDNGLSKLPNPATSPTNDMSVFPDSSSWAGSANKLNDPVGNAYHFLRDNDGYVLYQHDITGDSSNTSLVNYIAGRYTKGTYTVDAAGTVTQVTTGY